MSKTLQATVPVSQTVKQISVNKKIWATQSDHVIKGSSKMPTLLAIG